MTRFICSTPINVSNYRLGLTKDGIPKCLGPFVPIIRSKEPQDLRIILTLLNVGRVVKGDGSLDLKSITDPFSGNSERLKVISRLCREKLESLIDRGVIKKPSLEDFS